MKRDIYLVRPKRALSPEILLECFLPITEARSAGVQEQNRIRSTILGSWKWHEIMYT